MNREENPKTALMWRRVSASAGVLATVIGAVVLIGWLFDIETLKGILPIWVTMKANTALGFLLSGLAVFLLGLGTVPAKTGLRQAGKVLSATVFFIGLATLIEYVFDVNLGIDQFLFHEPEGTIGTLSPGRMAPTSALGFLFVGLALTLDGISLKSQRLYTVLAILVAILSLISLVGYLYNVQYSYGIGRATQMAAHTAVAFFFLAIGMFTLRPDQGLPAILSKKDSGGTTARHLLPIVLVMPIVIGYLKLLGDRLTVIEPAFGVGMVAIVYIVALSLLIYWHSSKLSLTDGERQQADEELKKSEERFRLLVGNAPDAIFVRDKSCFTYMNSAAIRLFGADSAQDLIGTPFIERYHPEIREDIRERMQILNEQHLAVPLKQSICLQMDGTEVDVESVAVPMNFEGKDGSLVFMRNITDRVKDQKQQQLLEEQLQQTQKIESLGRLAGGVAHDYNNMLSVILGYSELAQMKVEQAAPIQSDLEQIHQAAIRSRDITRQLLAFARKQIINPKVLDLNASVENTLKMLRTLLGENIDLVWNPKGDLWPIKIDSSQLDQILANLCVNARDAIADIGRMTIETESVSLDQEYCDDNPGFVPGDFVVLAVSDNGCGMDKVTVSKMFDPFYTTKGVGEGTGLGLATVYGIVKQSDGFINAYSELGEGTIFRIYLPRCEGEDVAVKETTASQVQKGQGETVLLVEDEVAIVQLATAMLEELGYRVLAANSPTEALSVAEVHTGEIQLLLTDVVMPDMNGRDLAKQVQEMYPEIKTLFMSGYTADIIAHHGVLDEGINFIQKPFARTDLSIQIREALGTKA